MINFIIGLLTLTLLLGCHPPSITEAVTPSIHKSFYSTLLDGRPVYQYQLLTDNIKVSFLTYGGIITAIEVPDKDGNFSNVVLGYDNLNDYEHNNRFFGAIVGRYANRIAKGELTLNNHQY